MGRITYAVFDGDNDYWAYRNMRGWTKNNGMTFNLIDAHDLDSMTYRAQSEDYVKSRLRERMRQADLVLVLVGEKTRYLYRFVRWELELAISLEKPIVICNLNQFKGIDSDRCPPIVRRVGAVHIPYRAKIIEHAMDTYFRKSGSDTQDYTYTDQTYRNLGLE